MNYIMAIHIYNIGGFIFYMLTNTFNNTIRHQDEFSKKNILITGISGQDGAYLAQELILDGYTVFGLTRGINEHNVWRLKELNLFDHPSLKIIAIDQTSYSNCYQLLDAIRPDEIYNLGGLSNVSESIRSPIDTYNSNTLTTINLLESIKNLNLATKFYQASSSEMFGMPIVSPQNEDTPFFPLSPYASSKIYAHHLTIDYYRHFEIFTSRGILFNHESPLRDTNFVSRKISNTVAKIKLGHPCTLKLGNMESVRDWGFAKDYVHGMRLILNHSQPDTFILSSFNSISIKSFVEHSFNCIGIKLIWDSDGINTSGYDSLTNKLLVSTDSSFYRPTQSGIMGDPSKAYNHLGWKSNTSIEQLCSIMIESDLKKLTQI